MKIAVVVSGMAIKGDLTSELIIMEDAARAIKEMDMIGIISRHTGIPAESIDEIMLMPEFTEAGDGSHVVDHKPGSRDAQVMLASIEVFIPFSGEVKWKAYEEIGKGFKKLFKGRLFNVNIRNNDERLYMSIKNLKKK